MSYEKSIKSVLFLSAILLVSCSENDPVKPIIVTDCSVINSITVTTTPELTFSWEPNCALMGWNIEPSGSGSDQWLVLYEGANSIEPPITYGVVPAGATEIHAPEILIPDSTYRLILFKWTGPGAQDGILLDTISFTM